MITVFMTKTSDAKNKRKTIKIAFFGSVKKMVFFLSLGFKKYFSTMDPFLQLFFETWYYRQK